jgi:quinol monooxygenase YgiN
MIHVIATIELQPGTLTQFLTEFRAVVPSVLREHGCLEYGPTVDVETNLPAQEGRREHVVTVVEKWHDMECLEAHLVAPHMLAYRERVKPFVTRVRLQILQPV